MKKHSSALDLELKMGSKEANAQWVVAMKNLAQLPIKSQTKSKILLTLASSKFDYVRAVLEEYTEEEWVWFITDRIPEARFMYS
jgi:hypothetical protein